MIQAKLLDSEKIELVTVFPFQDVISPSNEKTALIKNLSKPVIELAINPTYKYLITNHSHRNYMENTRLFIKLSSLYSKEIFFVKHKTSS